MSSFFDQRGESKMAARWRRCAAFTTIVIVLIALVILIALTTRIHSCDLIHEKPEFNLSTSKNIHSFDFSSLANFAGYIQYELQGTAHGRNKSQRILTLSYLPLEVDFITLFETKRGSYVFTINTDCAELLFNLDTRDKKIMVVDIKVSLTKSNLEIDECYIDLPSIETPVDCYYSCSMMREYKCETRKQKLPIDHPGLVVSLVVEKLEFEIDGDPNEIRLDQFSKKINQCKV